MMLAVPAGAVPLTVGTTLALGALAFVLAPLLSERAPDAAGPPPAPAPPRPPATRHAVSDDAVEAAIARARAVQRECPECGPRPEPDAVFCSNCGRGLSGVCPACATLVTQADARYCEECGAQLPA